MTHEMTPFLVMVGLTLSLAIIGYMVVRRVSAPRADAGRRTSPGKERAVRKRLELS